MRIKNKIDKSRFSVGSFVKKVDKPWGHELIFAPSEASVVGKMLHINKGARFSLQYHEKKQETLCLLQGRAKLIIEDKEGILQEIEMELRKGYFIRPFQKHRCQAITDCDILEASTREEGSTVRIEDDYNRGDETEEIRRQRSKS